MKQINFQMLRQKAIDVLKTTGRVTIILICLFIGFSAGEIYRAYLRGMASSSMPTVQKGEVTSVAINDRGELMIIDRGSGKYLLFSNDVGQAIFNQYASKIYIQRQTNLQKTNIKP